MRRSILTIAMLLGCAGMASAADLGSGSIYDVPATAPTEGYNWSGFYFGVQGGLGGGSFEYPYSLSSTTSATTFSGKVTDHASGGFGGVTAGANWQISPNFVTGVETDIASSNIEDTVGIRIGGSSGGVGGVGRVSAGSSVDWFGTTRLRAGWANGPLLLYGTGGIAYGGVTTSIKASARGSGVFGSFKRQSSDTLVGWTAGAGAEYALNSHWTLKTEYLYVDLGKENYNNNTLNILGTSANINVSRDTAFHTVKAGVNYRW